MADFAVVAAGVVARAGASITNGTAGATITAGQALHLDSNDSKWKLAQSDGTATEAGLNGRGIALHASLDGQPIDVITGGDWYPGALAPVAQDYYVSETPGGLAPRADVDLAGARIRTLLCTGLTVGDMRMVNSYTGAVKAA